jgi:hypothetical protein
MFRLIGAFSILAILAQPVFAEDVLNGSGSTVLNTVSPDAGIKPPGCSFQNPRACTPPERSGGGIVCTAGFCKGESAPRTGSISVPNGRH